MRQTSDRNTRQDVSTSSPFCTTWGRGEWWGGEGEGGGGERRDDGLSQTPSTGLRHPSFNHCGFEGV